MTLTDLRPGAASGKGEAKASRRRQDAGSDMDKALTQTGGPARALPPAPPRTISLGRRLVLSGMLVIGLGGTAVAVAALAYGDRAAERAFDRLLVGAANEIAGALLVRGGALAVDIPASAFELLALAPDDRVLYAVYDAQGRLLTGYPQAAPPRGRLEAGVVRFGEVPFAGEPARIAAVSRRFSEREFTGDITVVVGQTMRARDALAADIARSALLVVGLVGLLMVGLTAFAVRSALAPLRRIEQGLATREPRDLTPLDVAVPREISHLVAAINRFMTRQARQFGVMRNLIADASHQLRTPVAAIRAQAELAADEPDPERRQAILARIHARSVGLSRLTDQLLNHALIIHRSDAVPHETVDLREVAIRILEEGAPPDDAGDLALDLPEDPVPCRGDALSLVEAGKNLVANALRYGAPPVTIAVRRERTSVVLAVRDHGPGMTEAARRDAGRRFDRASAVSGTSAGIGLAIVHAVAAAHKGGLRFTQNAGGPGFEAAIVLPAAPGGPA